MLVKEVEGRLVGNPRLLQIHDCFKHLKRRRVFSKIGPEADLPHFMPEITMASDENADLARGRCRACDGPCGEPAGLAVIDADISCPGRCGEPCQQAKGRHSASSQILDSLADAWVV